jgi:hypothetical protein
MMSQGRIFITIYFNQPRSWTLERNHHHVITVKVHSVDKTFPQPFSLIIQSRFFLLSILGFLKVILSCC